jgi:hypothetical protein
MRTSRHFARHIAVSVALLLWLALANAATAQTSSPRTATVLNLHGKARYASDGKTWHPLKNGVTLPAGAVIQTGENSTLDLQLGESANIVKLFADSVLALDQLTLELAGDGQTMDIELDLRVGQIVGHVGKLSAASKYEIKFATGVAGVRGGVYRMSASGLVDVYDGQVVVVTRDAAVKVLAVGQRFDPGTGLVTQIPAHPPADFSAAPAPSNPAPAPTPNSPSLPPTKAPVFGNPLRKF